MRRRLSLALLIAISLSAATTSGAERWRDKLPERKLYMSITVLTLNDVKTELKLTTEQVSAIAAISKDTQAKATTKYKELRDEG